MSLTTEERKTAAAWYGEFLRAVEKEYLKPFLSEAVRQTRRKRCRAVQVTLARSTLKRGGGNAEEERRRWW